MKYSEDKTVYTFIVEDYNALTEFTTMYHMYDDDDPECPFELIESTPITHSEFKFRGTLQELGEFLEMGDFLQEDILESFKQFEQDTKNDVRNGENRIPDGNVVLGQLRGRKYDSICYYVEP